MSIYTCSGPRPVGPVAGCGHDGNYFKWYATVLSLPAFVCIAGVVVSGRHVMRHGGSSGKTRNHGFERHGIETRPHRRGRGKLESDKDMLSDPQPGARGW